MITPQYAVFDGSPCRWNFTEAWVFKGLPNQPGHWLLWDHSEVLLGAKLISEEDYLKKFPDLPVLPVGSFQENTS